VSANRAALCRLWKTDRKARAGVELAREAEDYWVLDRARWSLKEVLTLPDVCVYVVQPARSGRRCSTRGSRRLSSSGNQSFSHSCDAKTRLKCGTMGAGPSSQRRRPRRWGRRNDCARRRSLLLSPRWTVVPIPAGEKGPRHKGWGEQQLTEEMLPAMFQEALALADLYLHQTGAEFGCASKPRSHKLYVAAELFTRHSATPSPAKSGWSFGQKGAEVALTKRWRRPQYTRAESGSSGIAVMSIRRS